MTGDKSQTSLDVLGIKGLSDSVHTLTKASVDGVGALLSRICLPAAEELGLFFRDKVHAWRSKNASAIAQATEAFLLGTGAPESAHAHPRIVGKIFELGSWEDDHEVQNMWAGLLASACTEGGKDQRNLIFIHLLNQMSTSQVKLLGIICEKIPKFISDAGFVTCGTLRVSQEEVLRAFDTDDLQDADVQLDHLRELGLLHPLGGFDPNAHVADISPSPLALHLYVRSQGFRGSPIDYFKITTKLEKNQFPTVLDSITS